MSLRKARGLYYLFSVLNSLSFVLVSGSLVTLYAMRLGASDLEIGVLNSLGFVTFFFMPIGKLWTRRHPIVRVFGGSWMLRYLSMAPLLLSPLLHAAGQSGAAVALVLLATAGFNFFRGTGLIGNNPVQSYLAGEGRKGAFLITISLLGSAASVATSLAAALVLRLPAASGDGAAWIYAAFAGAGIAIGCLGSAILLGMPEPEGYDAGKGVGLVVATKQALKDRLFRRYMAVLGILAFVSGMARSFMPVWAKSAYGQSDASVMVLGLAGSIGSIAMGLLARVVVDRLGPKPLFAIFAFLASISLVPAAIGPGLAGGAAFAFLLAVNFVSSFGFSGEESASQAYYYILVPRALTLDLGVIYYLVYGLAGAAGSFLGGAVLEGMGGLGLSAQASYRIFYGLNAILALAAAVMISPLKRLGAASVKESVGLMLNPRDLRDFGLLDRLDRTRSPEEEVAIIRGFGGRGSATAARELLSHLESPRFNVRMEALLAFERFERLPPEAVQALIDELRCHPWTSAYVAARVLGKQGAVESVPVLREALGSEDYMLRGQAMVALARLKDEESRERIEELVVRDRNPRVAIHAAYALELFGNPASVPALVSSLRRSGEPDFVREETVLALASILGMREGFYPAYREYAKCPERGMALLEEAVADNPGNRRDDEKAYAAWRQAAFRALDGCDCVPLSRLLLSRESGVEAVSLVLGEAAMEADLAAHGGFRFFLAYYAGLW